MHSGNDSNHRSTEHWRSVRIECEPGFEDILSMNIFESGFSGLEEKKTGYLTVFTAYFSKSSAENNPLTKLERTLDDMAERLGAAPGKILLVENVPSEDWEISWRESLKAVEVGSSIVVRPSWVAYPNHGGRIEIVIDPKMAFGTGSHATTYLCLEALERHPVAGQTVLDAGCGSGVLSIAAAKFGARIVRGFDRDQFSIANARENIAINTVADCVTVELADLAEYKADAFDVVFANMISGVLIPNLAVFHSFVTRKGLIVFSGLLAEEETMFADALKERGFAPLEITRRDEWIAVYAAVKTNR